jgi:hypothetical protein
MRESPISSWLIASFKKKMPLSDLDGFRRACADDKYTYICPNSSIKYFSMTVSCQLEELPETYYMDTLAKVQE